ncbi:hypothetical protein LTR37_008972 [Vermiconidia calcicola]|uniref:Uncharacterized protein n=1 Tax=Vermiconidia calcicola TaxID=1690605 RepID=A0ACC3NAD9_9PEZI|nr:hypothetical protein LTR37_008972 [Vermiconidia calcicola]
MSGRSCKSAALAPRAHPDDHIAARAKGRLGTKKTTPAKHALAETLKELTTTVVKTVDNAKKRLTPQYCDKSEEEKTMRQQMQDAKVTFQRLYANQGGQSRFES